MATASEKRLAVRDKYKTILGRNLYSQPRRAYCFKKYSDGKYYSDCSSSIAKCYEAAGYPFPGNTCPNTAGMCQAAALKKVDVTIRNGVIQNPDALRIGDMLLFAGTDPSRAYVGYAGHVEMVGEINGGKVYLYGHGSGTPRRTEMNAYCGNRYASKTKATALGHKGLIKVVRCIQDDGIEGESVVAWRSLRKGVSGADVKELQTQLIQLGYSCGKCGADGDFGADTEAAVRKFQKDHGCGVDGEVGPETRRALEKALGVCMVKISGGQCWVRSAPNTGGKQLGVAAEGREMAYGGQMSADGWLLVEFDGRNGWVSGMYGRLVG